jgi:sentrin-specific protease 8
MCSQGSLSKSTSNHLPRFLEHDVLDKYKNAHIVLLKPTMAMMLRAGEYSNLPDFSKTTHIFIPVNNANTNASAESGSHWSLLLVSVVDGTAFHYDSSEEMNLEPAEDCAANLGKHLRRRLRVISLGDSPQQRNSSDCGVYVCMAMRHLLTRRLLKKNSSEKVSMSLGGRDIDARAGRKEMLAIIKECRKEGEKRRS